MAEMGKKFGAMPCPEHPKIVLLVRKSEKTGTLSARCDECDDTHYAKKDTGKHSSWLQKITKADDTPTTPAPGAPGAPDKKPAKAGIW